MAETKTNGSKSLATDFLPRLTIALAIDALAIWFIYNLLTVEHYFLAIVIAIITIVGTIVILRENHYPLRWMMVGLALMTLFAIYPILFTVYIAFTNFGDGHLLSKEQAINQLEKSHYLPEGRASYSWTAFRNDGGNFILWLQDSAGNSQFAQPDQPIITPQVGENGIGELDSDGIPTEIAGYERLNRLTVIRYLNDLSALSFGTGDQIVQIRNLDSAAQLQQKYTYDTASDTITDQESGLVYTPKDGTFTAPGGVELQPGFQANIGISNFRNFFTSSVLRGPLVQIISWNFAFAFFSVFLTFALGLAIAIFYNDPDFPGKKIIQSFLLIPYTIPSLITILIWKGLLNPQIGIVNNTLNNLFGTAPDWFANHWWTKAGILLVNLWLGYPYFMLICSGALQAIPSDIYEAATVDGASQWQRFRSITLPLLLVAVGPLLLASFTFNFNNFNLIFLFNAGGPPISNSLAKAGHTDILISYVYNLAFGGGRGQDYGLASAITLVIFVLVAVMTLFQFRYTRMLEEVSENV